MEAIAVRSLPQQVVSGGQESGVRSQEPGSMHGTVQRAIEENWTISVKTASRFLGKQGGTTIRRAIVAGELKKQGGGIKAQDLAAWAYARNINLHETAFAVPYTEKQRQPKPVQPQGVCRAGENYLTEAEEKKLFAFLRNRKDRQAERDYVLIRFGRALGLRRTELIALNVADVYGKDTLSVDDRIAAKGGIGDLHIPAEKGDKNIQALLRWFFRRKREWGESMADDAPLFCSRLGGRLGERSVNYLMEKWCREAGIPRYTPHALRHTKAQRIMNDVRHLTYEEQKKALLFTNRQLRQKSIAATLVYTRPSKEEMMKVGAI